MAALGVVPGNWGALMTRNAQRHRSGARVWVNAGRTHRWGMDYAVLRETNDGRRISFFISHRLCAHWAYMGPYVGSSTDE